MTSEAEKLKLFLELFSLRKHAKSHQRDEVNPNEKAKDEEEEEEEMGLKEEDEDLATKSPSTKSREKCVSVLQDRLSYYTRPFIACILRTNCIR